MFHGYCNTNPKDELLDVEEQHVCMFEGKLFIILGDLMWEKV